MTLSKVDRLICKKVTSIIINISFLYMKDLLKITEFLFLLMIYIVQYEYLLIVTLIHPFCWYLIK